MKRGIRKLKVVIKNALIAFPGAALYFVFSASSFAQQKTNLLPVIPQPSSVISGQGNFELTAGTVIVVPQITVDDEGKYFQSGVQALTGMNLQVVKVIPENGKYIFFQVVDMHEKPDVFHEILITEASVQISASSPEEIFHSMQTLIQVIGAGDSLVPKIPCCTILDYPRYSWRGMHLDVCRHFFTKNEVKKYLDLLTLYKFNIFHWHLTEDQGWRIEIKKYPLLTEIGSQRKETVIGKPGDTAKYDGKPYGGFYTQEDIKEIVAYAQARHITIVPEIEMPGHALAALSAYPQFSCCMEPLESATTWGVFDDVYCAGNDSTFEFIENILNEVCELFPGKYIHIGGDECPKERWMLCEKCQRRIKNEKLQDEHELQSYFISRIEKFLNAKGKQIIGWDEILEGGLAPNAAVMSWRGTKGGVEAAKQKHFVVMSPGKPCYFDHYQSKNKKKEPLAIGGYNPLDSVYNYNPTPSQLEGDESDYILGAQGNVWTEYITDFRHVEYMSVPRMCALAETLWTPPSKKDFKNFISRLKIHSRLLDRMKVNYAKHFINKK
ncbi:MAG TPA: beta-N-acetylhexosaminidase [Bacteroidia bacterium]|nr:beta-N-acetylhexosaminidase [Bacteroidia bacterium]